MEVCALPFRLPFVQRSSLGSVQSIAPSRIQLSCTIGKRSVYFRPIVVQPLASRVCDLTGKRRNNGYKVSHSNHRTKKLQQVNLQYRRLWWEEGRRFVRLRICTKVLKTIDKKGLHKAAKDYGVDLSKF